MESFKSPPHAIACNALTIYSKLTNPSLIKQLIDAHADRIQGEARQHMDTVKFSDNAISIQSPMGEVSLTLDRVPISMVINLEPQPDETIMSTAELQLDLPFFLRKMVEGQLQEGANRFGELLALIPFDRI